MTIVQKSLQLINLIKKHGSIESTNQLAKHADSEGICSRQTVFNLIDEIKADENVIVTRKNGSDHYSYKDATSDKNIVIINEIKDIEKSIKEYCVMLNDIKSMKINLESDKDDLMKTGIKIKSHIIKLQQRLIHFEACGFRKSSVNDRFEKVQKRLSKIDLDVHKAIYKKDKQTIGNIWQRVNYEINKIPMKQY